MPALERRAFLLDRQLQEENNVIHLTNALLEDDASQEMKELAARLAEDNAAQEIDELTACSTASLIEDDNDFDMVSIEENDNAVKIPSQPRQMGGRPNSYGFAYAPTPISNCSTIYEARPADS